MRLTKLKRDGSEGFFECDVCHEYFTDSLELDNHMEKEHEQQNLHSLPF
jgi:uncharacterized C2H2 Zn-finger protein